MDKIDDGGPAFPTRDYLPPGAGRDTATRPEGGMSLRDWFAGQALAGILVQNEALPSDYHCGAMDVSEWAYAYADAMLAERAKGAK